MRKAIAFILLLNCSFCIGQNVGIGTIMPNRPLTVKATGIGITQQSPDGTTEIGFYTENGTAFLQTNTNHSLFFSTNNESAQMALSTTGNVGIGYPAPQYKLAVDGTTHFNGH